LSPVYVVQPRDVCQEIAGALLESRGQTVLVVLDLAQLGWTIERVGTWIVGFRQEYQLRFFDRTRDAGGKRGKTTTNPVKAFPMIAVMGIAITEHQHEQLVDAGASVVNRSVPANADCQTPEQLFKKLFPDLVGQPTTPPATPLPWTAPVLRIPEADPAAFNGYPAGIKAGDLGKALTNQQEDPPES